MVAVSRTSWGFLWTALSLWLSLFEQYCDQAAAAQSYKYPSQSYNHPPPPSEAEAEDAEPPASSLTEAESYVDKSAEEDGLYWDNEESLSEDSSDEYTSNEDYKTYWESCTCSEGYERSSHYHSHYSGYSHSSYSFIVLLTINNCTDNSNNFLTFGNGFIASPYCVVSTVNLLHPAFYPYTTCLNVTVSFCQPCISKHHYPGATNYTVIIGNSSLSSSGSVTYHRNSNWTDMTYNMAIITLDVEIPKCATIACWYDRNSVEDWYYPDLPTIKLMLCGFGADDEYEDRSDCQRCISCYQGSQERCMYGLEEYGFSMHPFEDTCLLCHKDQAFCNGGSSGVILYEPPSHSKYKCPVVIGIASWTITDCTEPRPIVYVSTFIKKVSQLIERYCNCKALPGGY